MKLIRFAIVGRVRILKNFNHHAFYIISRNHKNFQEFQSFFKSFLESDLKLKLFKRFKIQNSTSFEILIEIFQREKFLIASVSLNH